MDGQIVNLYAQDPNGTLYALLTGTHNLFLAAAKETHMPLHVQLDALNRFNSAFASHHNVTITGFVYQRSNWVDEHITLHVVVASAIWMAEETIDVLNALGKTDEAAMFAGLVRNALERIAAVWYTFADHIIYGVDVTYQQALINAAAALRMYDPDRYNNFLSILSI